MKLSKKQKIQLHRPRPLLFLVVIAILGVPLVGLFAMGHRARQQQPKIDRQAIQYFSDLPVYVQNESALEFDRLATDLGFLTNGGNDPTLKINPDAAVAFQTITPSLLTFLHAQTTKTAGPLDAPPPDLASYLDTYDDTIKKIQAHMLSAELPLWEMDMLHMPIDSLLPGFVNVFHVQKLLLLSVIDTHQQGRTADSIETLEASWRLNQAIAQRPDLVSQTLAAIVSAQQAGIIRHLQAVPTHWQRRLSEQNQQRSVIDGVTFEMWLQYLATRRSWQPPRQTAQTGETLESLYSTTTGGPKETAFPRLSSLFSPEAYFQLIFLDTIANAQESLTQLGELDVCSTPPVVVEQLIDTVQTARWHKGAALSPMVTAKRWKLAGDRALAAELSQQVLQVKQHFTRHGTWPEALANPNSLTCPGESWIYTVSEENTVTITLSKTLLTLPVIPLQYQTERPAKDT
ncbi:MAG: hypothetical protein AAFP20_12560 [Cyanobacteria bacterium J06614_10]